MVKIQLVTKPLNEIKNDYLVFPIFEGEKINLKDKVVDEFFKDNPKFGKLFESQLLYLNQAKVLLLGIGKKDKLNYATLQNWFGATTKSLAKKTKQLSVILPRIDNLNADEIGHAITIGSWLALYDPAKNYKSDYEPSKLSSIEVVVERAERGFLEGIKKGEIVAENINLARSLGDMPSNEMTPTYFLTLVKKLAKENKLKLTILDEKQAQKKGMGAFVSVAQGSDEPSYMIALEYKGDIKTKDKWGLIGKGVTFDSGGVSLKPSDKLTDMKYDMLGAATVLATILTISKLGLKTNVVAVMPVTENMISGKAFKPDDILRSYSGKTVEIVTTDAEGRVVLIDGLTYAQKDFKATKLIDVATLTGAIVIALGDFIAGAFSNNQKFVENLITAGKSVGEKFWQMPMDDEYGEMMKGELADLRDVGMGGSVGTRTAGSITGAKFIEAVVENNTPWIHLDIAGTGWDLKNKPYRHIGATGIGIKTLVKLIEESKS